MLRPRSNLVDDPAHLLEERLVYRGDFWLGTLMRFLPIVTQIFLWGAVFAGMERRASQRLRPDRRLSATTT